MENKNDLEYRLDDPEEEDIQNELLEKKDINKNKIIIFAIIISIVIVAGVIIVIFVLIKPSKKKKDYYIYKNIKIAEKKLIINSFKLYGENFNPILGNMNNGNDYKETDRNNFDICIPYNITKRKNKYNRIFLLIHGGGWVDGEK